MSSSRRARVSRSLHAPMRISKAVPALKPFSVRNRMSTPPTRIAAMRLRATAPGKRMNRIGRHATHSRQATRTSVTTGTHKGRRSQFNTMPPQNAAAAHARGRRAVSSAAGGDFTTRACRDHGAPAQPGSDACARVRGRPEAAPRATRGRIDHPAHRRPPPSGPAARAAPRAAGF